MTTTGAAPTRAGYFQRRRHVWLGYGQVLIDVTVLAASFFAAFAIRFDGRVPPQWLQVAFSSMPYVVAMSIAALSLGRARRSVWRYTGVREVGLIIVAITLVAVVLTAVRLLAPRPLVAGWLPLGVIAINFLLSIFGLSAVRFARRFQYEQSKMRSLRPDSSKQRVLLVGAGDAGRLVAREIGHRPDLALLVRGFVDDDAHKRGKWIEGTRVLGPIFDLARLVASHEIDAVIITLANAPSQKIREIVQACAAIPVPVRIIPGIYEIVGERVTVNQIRGVRIEDLLAREVVQFDPDAAELIEAYRGRRVLVTGAGGSIGSELCRQLALLKPALIVLLDKDENAVFEVDLMLREFLPEQQRRPVILDLRREDALRRVFQSYRPEVVVHAAAHKHVPLLEHNVVEGVDNNVLGTELLVRLSVQHDVRTFVMVSTDKAVNPANVLGATKRLAEMVVQVAAQRSGVRFSCVRFGNVLESRGSVVPIFKRQIERGGPITVTHPEITRYFMTIGEAAQLIIQAGSLGRNGDIFVLDMGQPVKLVDMARDLARLALPGRGDEIAIQFTGLRPGEKLHEELLVAEEGVRATKFRKIMIAPQRPIDPDLLAAGVQRLRQAVTESDENTLKTIMADLEVGSHFRAPANPRLARAH